MARPRKVVTDDHLRQVEFLSGLGLTEASIAHTIGVSPDTFARRKESEPEVLRALENGKAKAQGVISQALFNKAKSGDLGAIVWWEKTRAGRVDSSQVRHANAEGTGDLPTPNVNIYEYQAMTPLERVARVQELLALAQTRANGNGKHP